MRKYLTPLASVVIGVLVASAAWAEAANSNSSRSNDAGAKAPDVAGAGHGVRKKPGRTTYGDITLKRGVVGAAAKTDGPTTTGAKSSKPKEIVVVGSKTKKQSHEASHVVQQKEVRPPKAEVRGWDPKDKKAIEGKAD